MLSPVSHALRFSSGPSSKPLSKKPLKNEYLQANRDYIGLIHKKAQGETVPRELMTVARDNAKQAERRYFNSDENKTIIAKMFETLLKSFSDRRQ
ncbi:MAG: hypothetical protein K0Q50_551 [Vampirovibrio sp.]|jgi:ribosomal protein L17|nr:hypothetical protein [Vampirovibrio sp.]